MEIGFVMKFFNFKSNCDSYRISVIQIQLIETKFGLENLLFKSDYNRRKGSFCNIWNKNWTPIEVGYEKSLIQCQRWKKVNYVLFKTRIESTTGKSNFVLHSILFLRMKTEKGK